MNLDSKWGFRLAQGLAGLVIFAVGFGIVYGVIKLA